MAACILARIRRGRLFFPVANALFLAFNQAAAALGAAEAHRLDIVGQTSGSGSPLIGEGVAWAP